MMFKRDRYESGAPGHCPECGVTTNAAKCLEAHPWQELEQVLEERDTYFVAAEGDDLEMRCTCGAIYWAPGQARFYR